MAQLQPFDFLQPLNSQNNVASQKLSHVTSACMDFVGSHIKDSVKTSSILAGWQTVDERKSQCPDEDGIYPSSNFPQLQLRCTNYEETAPSGESSGSPGRSHSTGCDGGVLVTPSALISNSKRKELTITRHEKLSFADVIDSVTPTDSEVTILLSHNPQNCPIPERPLFQLFFIRSTEM